MRIYSLFTTMTMIGCLHMCGGPVRHSGANRVIDIRDSCPKLEKIFKSAMLQDSLESFYELIDTSDFFILALPGKKISQSSGFNTFQRHYNSVIYCQR